MLGKEELLVAGALRRLFKNRFILRSRNENWFQVLVEQHERLRQVLRQMGADLELDITWGIAYVKSLSDEIEDQLEYQLGFNKTLGRYPSLLLYFLRLRRLSFYRNPDADVPLVQREEMRAFLNDFNPHLESGKFEKEFNKALQDLCDVQIILHTGLDERYEITPVCDVLLPADEISVFKNRFEQYLKSLGKAVTADENTDEEN